MGRKMMMMIFYFRTTIYIRANQILSYFYIFKEKLILIIRVCSFGYFKKFIYKLRKLISGQSFDEKRVNVRI